MSSQDQFNLNFSEMTTFIPQLARQQSSMKALKPHTQAHLLSPTNKCKICEEPAARHVQYGASTCFSCRAFFRRSLQNKTSAKYTCMRHSMCEMNIKTRKNCQYCRYMKCLAIGMNPNYVLSEDEKKQRFKKRKISITEEPTRDESLMLATPTGIASAGEQRIKNKDIFNNEIITKTVLRNVTENGLFKKPYQRQAASANTGKHQGNTIPTSQTGQNQVRKIALLQRNYIEKMPETRRGSFTYKQSYLPQPTNNAQSCLHLPPENAKSCLPLTLDNTQSCLPPLPPVKMQIRSSIIKRIGYSFYNTKLGAQQAEVIENVLKHPEIKTCQGKAVHAFKEEIKFKESKTNAHEIETISESEDDIFPQIRMNLEPEIIFSEDEKNQLDKLVKDHDMVYHSVNFGEVFIKEMLMCSMFGVALSTSAAITGYRLAVERITRIANTLKCFTCLHKVDQVALLKENVDLLVSLRGAIFFNKKKKGMDQVLSSMGKEDMDTIEKTFRPMIKNHYMNHIDYNVFNSIQDPGNQKTEERYSFLQGKVADSIVDNVTTILITYIILFSSDFCTLEDRRAVERTQVHVTLYYGFRRLIYFRIITWGYFTVVYTVQAAATRLATIWLTH